jgi:hypothetical protein
MIIHLLLKQSKWQFENRVAFAIRQRRYMAKLHFMESGCFIVTSAWKQANKELLSAQIIAFHWHSEKMLQYSEALLDEMNKGI